MKWTCPRCGGDVVVVRDRAWCVRMYRDGGCGAHFTSWSRRRLDPPYPHGQSARWP